MADTDENLEQVSDGIYFKPLILASWIPDGEIHFKPLILATIVPTPTKISADLARRVCVTELTVADAERKINRSEKILADSARELSSSEKISADSRREVKNSEKISADLALNVIASSTANADTFREVKSYEKTSADTARKIGLVTVRADLSRKIKAHIKNNFDLCRKIAVDEKIPADTERILINAERIGVDTERNVQATEKIRADAEIKIGISEKIFVDACRAIGKSEKILADTKRNVSAQEKILADLQRSLREVARVDTCRKINRQTKRRADTVIRMPHILNYFVQADNLKLNSWSKARLLDAARGGNDDQLISTLVDYKFTNLNVSLKAKTLSDEFTFSSANIDWKINSAVQGKLFDYEFNFLVEEINESAPFLTATNEVERLNSLTQEIKCKYNQDELLYSWFDFEFEEKKASRIIAKLADALGLSSKVFIAVDFDFTPTNLASGKITYADLLTELFGWTSKVPTKQINVYIRGNTLYCVQRGREDSGKIVNLDSLPYANPRTKKSLYRVLCNNPNSDSSDGGDDDEPIPFSGNLFYTGENFSINLRYSDGLLVSEFTKLISSNNLTESSTTYDYVSFSSSDSQKKEKYLSVKSQKNINILLENGEPSNKSEATTITQYHYKTENRDVWLVAEEETSSVTEYSRNKDSAVQWDKGETETHIRQTNHVPVGNGWFGQVVFLDGELQGANISEGKPGNAISPHTVNQMQLSLKHVSSADEIIPSNSDSDSDELSAIDASADLFPIKESEVISNWKAELKKLHGSTLEEMSCELVAKIDKGKPADFLHIVDFDDHISSGGRQLFLETNSISFTPRKFIQKLQFVRFLIDE